MSNASGVTPATYEGDSMNVKKVLLIAGGSIFALGVIGSLAGQSQTKSNQKGTVVTTQPAAPNVTATTAAPATTTTKAPTTTTVAMSSCDRVREALLTGTQAEINAAMAQLQTDQTADQTAREYADYYLHRDAGDAQLRQADVGLIRMSCS
jgi:hypothetical protein